MTHSIRIDGSYGAPERKPIAILPWSYLVTPDILGFYLCTYLLPTETRQSLQLKGAGSVTQSMFIPQQSYIFRSKIHTNLCDNENKRLPMSGTKMRVIVFTRASQVGPILSQMRCG